MIKIAVCDDEPTAIDILVDKIHLYMFDKKLEYVISKFTDGESLLFHLNNSSNHFDIIYLDIKMNKINGIDVAKEIRGTDNNVFIVFITALKEYVFDAFDVSASNFIVKPIIDYKFFLTLDRILLNINSMEQKSLIISTSKESVKIPFANIVYCEVLNHRIFIYEHNCMHEYIGEINTLESKLNMDFFRCHRSYIINLKFVERYKDGFAYMASLEKIPIATRRRQAFTQALLKFHKQEVY